MPACLSAPARRALAARSGSAACPAGLVAEARVAVARNAPALRLSDAADRIAEEERLALARAALRAQDAALRAHAARRARLA